MAKRSRRARRQAAEKRRQSASIPQKKISDVTPSSPATEATPIVIPTPEAAPVLSTVDAAQPISHEAVNFAQDYHHVYSELRTVLIIAILMFAILIGLSYVF